MFDTATTTRLYQLYVEQHGSLVCMDEFQEEVSRILYISRLLRKFKNSGETNVRLLVNHVIILYNVFDNKVTPIVFDAINNDLHPELRGLLSYFNRLPKGLTGETNMGIIEYIEDGVNA